LTKKFTYYNFQTYLKSIWYIVDSIENNSDNIGNKKLNKFKKRFNYFNCFILFLILYIYKLVIIKIFFFFDVIVVKLTCLKQIFAIFFGKVIFDQLLIEIDNYLNYFSLS